MSDELTAVPRCPARLTGPFVNSDANEIRCADVDGHDGAHFFHVEWGGTSPRWVKRRGKAPGATRAS